MLVAAVVWIWDALLAVGVLFTLETQLRAGAGAIGPGELCLVAWQAPLLFLLLGRADAVVPQACWDLLRFWIVFGLALCVGDMTAVFIGDIHDSSLFWHDVFAYALLASLTCLIASLPRFDVLLDRVEWLFVIFGTLSILLQAANTWGLFSLPRIDPWYWDRVRGWSDNPDQLALLCLILGGLALHLAERARRRPARLFAAVCALVVVAYGWTARSNAYSVVIVACAALFATTKFARRALASDADAPWSSALLVCFVALAPLVLAAPALNSDLAARARGEVGASLLRKGSDEDLALRLRLWSEGLNRGVDAWMLGLGPGPHLPIPGVILDGRRSVGGPVNISHPDLALAPNFETHNSLVELFVQGGFLAEAAFLWLCAHAFARAWRARQDGLIALLCGLAVYGSFGVILRHPSVWLVILLALAPQASRRDALARFSRAPRPRPA